MKPFSCDGALSEMGSLPASEGLADLLLRRNLVFSQEETLPSDLGSWALGWPAVTVVLELGCCGAGVGANGIDGAVRLVTDSAGLVTELVGELVGGSSFEAAGTLGCEVAGVLSGASWVSVADARSSGNGGDLVPSLSTGAETTRWAINSAVNEPIGADVFSVVDAGSMEVAGFSKAVGSTLVLGVGIGSTAGSSTGGTAGPMNCCSSGSTDIGSVIGIGSRAGGSDSFADNASGASATSSGLRLAPCLSSLSSAFLALASRFSSSTQH